LILYIYRPKIFITSSQTVPGTVSISQLPIDRKV